MGRPKFFELLDFPKFANPSVLSLQAAPTALNLRQRIGGGGFMSYGQIWSRLSDLVRGFVTEEYLLTVFNAYKAEWKNRSIREAVRLLNEHFGGKGTWYPIATKPKYVLGFWFKPSIKGIWYFGDRAFAVLINARKGQPLTQEDVRFLARGVYELHCIDDPNDPIPLIVDLSKHEDDDSRKLRVYPLLPDEAASLENFEHSVREFLIALNIAGISLPVPPAIENVLDLFKR